MFVQRVLISVAAAMLLVAVASDVAHAQKKSGTTIGTIKAKAPTPNGKNVIIDVQSPGDEATRKFRVQFDPKIKAPMADVLQAVKAATVGDQVKFDWVDTGEGLAITKFEVVKKGGDKGNK
jgi:hypothetical protein